MTRDFNANTSNPQNGYLSVLEYLRKIENNIQKTMKSVNYESIFCNDKQLTNNIIIL